MRRRSFLAGLLGLGVGLLSWRRRRRPTVRLSTAGGTAVPAWGPADQELWCVPAGDLPAGPRPTEGGC